MASHPLHHRLRAGLQWMGCLGLVGGVTLAGAEPLLPAGPELALAPQALQPIAARSLREAALDLQMRPPGGGGWQLTLQRYAPPWQPPGLAPAPQGLALGIYVHAGTRTQLGWQSRPWGGHEAAAPWDDATPARTAGAMTLRSADPLADLRLGALAKFSLGPQTSISLRPRKGGLRLYLQAQWQ